MTSDSKSKAIGIIRAEHRALGPVSNNNPGNFEAAVPASLETLQATVAAYADFTWKHLRAEENDVLPLAQSHLLASDWDAIADAFAQNADPLVGSADNEMFDALFHDIVKRTPAPLGLGAA